MGFLLLLLLLALWIWWPKQKNPSPTPSPQIQELATKIAPVPASAPVMRHEGTTFDLTRAFG